MNIKKISAFLCAVALIGTTNMQMTVQAKVPDDFNWEKWSAEEDNKINFEAPLMIWGKNCLYPVNSDNSDIEANVEEYSNVYVLVYEWDIPVTEIYQFDGETGISANNNTIYSAQPVLGEKYEKGMHVKVRIVNGMTLDSIELTPNFDFNECAERGVEGYLLPELTIEYKTDNYDFSEITLDEDKKIISNLYNTQYFSKKFEGEKTIYEMYRMFQLVPDFEFTPMLTCNNHSNKGEDLTIKVFGKEFMLLPDEEYQGVYTDKRTDEDNIAFTRSFDNLPIIDEGSTLDSFAPYSFMQDEKFKPDINALNSFGKLYSTAVTVRCDNAFIFEFFNDERRTKAFSNYGYNLINTLFADYSTGNNTLNDEGRALSTQSLEFFGNVQEKWSVLEMSFPSRKVAENIKAKMANTNNIDADAISIDEMKNGNDTFYRVYFDLRQAKGGIVNTTATLYQIPNFLFTATLDDFRDENGKLIDGFITGIPLGRYEDNDFYHYSGSDRNYISMKQILDGIADNTVIKGDINKDGSVTVADVVRLKRYLLGDSIVTVNGVPQDIYIDKRNSDLNGDGIINVVDMILLKKSLL